MASPLLALAKSPPPKSPAVSSKRKNQHCWSNLPLDLMLMVFERLGFADFERAKSVCSSWYSDSKQSKPNNQIPWMILFPEDKNYCLLFNPEDKEKLYKTQDLGDDFAESECLTTYQSWLLMYASDLYILNLLTRERINLPAFTPKYGLPSPILWIDEKTKDYLVMGLVDAEAPYLLSFKKGDNSWKKIPQLPSECIYDCFHMVYKDHKLYCLNYDDLCIFDFSGEIPQQVFRISVCGLIEKEIGIMKIRLPYIPWELQTVGRKNSLVVTVRGDVLIVRCIRPYLSKTWEFNIFKMGSSKENKWEEIFYLGDESIILDLGITVLAKDIEGITSNSIYFNAYNCLDEYVENPENNIFIFNLETKKVERPYQVGSSSVPFLYAHWFLPSFKQE